MALEWPQLPVSATVWTLGTLGAYMSFYTAYSKQQKTLVIQDLLDVVLVRKSLDHSLVQLNKIVCLAGITNLAVYFCPFTDLLVRNPDELLAISTAMIGLHSLYSTYRYYDSAKFPRISEYFSIFSDLFSGRDARKLRFKKKVSLVFGTMAILFLDAITYGFIKEDWRIASGVLTLGLGHFFLMEQDPKGKLQIRPFGYLGFLAPIGALASILYYRLK